MRKRRVGGLGRSVGRTVGRTALIAGTAQHVSGRVAARQHAGAHGPSAKAHTTNAKGHGTHAKPGMITDEAMDQLKKLAELRDAGVLTEKEFAAKKAKLLP